MSDFAFSSSTSSSSEAGRARVLVQSLVLLSVRTHDICRQGDRTWRYERYAHDVIEASHKTNILQVFLQACLHYEDL